MITVQVTFSEAVTIATTNLPSIPITIGSTARAATAAAAATPATRHSFSYTVVAADHDSDGIQVVTAAVLSNPGSIADAASNAMTATEVPDNLNTVQSTHKVATPPRIASIALSGSGPYHPGQEITLAVTFNEAVEIATTNLPSIPITVGTTARAATAAAAATASATHNFVYTVVLNETDSDGISVATAAVLSNPGSISDADDNVMTATAVPDTLNAAQASHKVETDSTAPTIASIAFTSTGPYSAGDTITLQATFSEKVTIASTNLPTIPITIGSTARAATTTAAATASEMHNFSYTVVAADSDSDGISVATAAVVTNFTSIEDVSSNAMANGDIPNALNSDQSSHKVETLPTITGLTITSTGPYMATDAITIQATFSKAVTIETPLPTLPITIGTTARTATTAAAATGSTMHNFSYTVVAADSDDDGITVAANAVLSNPGSVKDADDNAMTATALPDDLSTAQAAHKVDNAAPTLSSISITSTASRSTLLLPGQTFYRAGDTITVQATFSEAVVIGTATPAASIPLTIGSNTRAATVASTATPSSTHNFSYTVAADTDSDGIQILTAAVLSNPGRITDAAGNALTVTDVPDTYNSAQTAHRVDGVAPAVTIVSATSRSSSAISAGDNILLRFSEAISASGTTLALPNPSNFSSQLTLKEDDSDGDNIAFSFTYSHGTSTLTITPTNDLSGDVYVAVSSSYWDLIGNPGAAANATFTVDTSVPTLDSFRLTSTGPYKLSDTITIEATFSENVTIVGSAPGIPITIGSTPRNATASATTTGSTTHNFSFTIGITDLDPDGIAVAAAATLVNAGSVIDAAGNGVTDTTLPNTLSTAQTGHTVDGVAPTISSIAFSGTGPYHPGQNITLVATFNEAVKITGTNLPSIPITIGTTARAATAAAAATASATHNFVYTVVLTETDSDGITVAAAAVVTNPGAISDATGNVMTATAVPDTLDSGYTGQANQKVETDTTAPTIASIAFTSTGPYAANSVITLQATFSEKVTIASTNLPSIPITIDTTPRAATATAAATADTMHDFSYTVVAADSDSDGISVATAAVVTNFTSIEDVSSNAMANGDIPDTLNDDQSGHTVLSGLRISGLSITSTGPYMATDAIIIQATFSKVVTIETPLPTLPITINTTARTATTAATATGSTTHNFTYTVVAADSDDDGITVAANAVLSNPGSVKDADDNAMTVTDLPDNLSTAQGEHKVDNTAPTIADNGLSITTTGPYDTGDVITVQVTFSEAVTIATTNLPSIPITIGSTARAATAAAAATPATMHNFSYTVVAADHDSDGIQVVTAAVLSNPGSIADAASNAMTATEVPDNLNTVQSTHKVATPPRIASIALSGSGPYHPGQEITLAVTFNEAVEIATTNLPSIPITVGTTARAATAAAAATASATHNFVYTVVLNETDSDGISVATAAVLSNPGSISDADDNVMTATAVPDTLNAAQASHKVETDSTAPTIASIAFTSTGPYSAGDTITLQATFSEKVTIASTNLPTIPITIGSTARAATTTAAATASEMHNFSYTVVAADSDSDGISVATAAVVTNFTSIEDVSSNAMANGDIPNALNSDQSSHKVETLPTITGLTITSTGPYMATDINHHTGHFQQSGYHRNHQLANAANNDRHHRPHGDHSRRRYRQHHA